MDKKYFIVVVGFLLVCILLYNQFRLLTTVGTLHKEEMVSIQEQKDSIKVLKNRVDRYAIISDSLFTAKFAEKQKQKQIVIKYVPIYEKIISTPDSLQFLITKELLAKHRSTTLER